MSSASTRSVTPALVIGAIGIVFGDVGTSLLYALRAVMQTGLNPLLLSDVLGVLSLIFWAIALVVGLKYVAIVLRADNDGEGGVLALTQLALARAHFNIAGPLSVMGLVGCALFFGDGVITPRHLGAECRGGPGTTSALVRASDRSSVRARHHLDAVPDHPDAGYRLRLYLCARWG